MRKWVRSWFALLLFQQQFLTHGATADFRWFCPKPVISPEIGRSDRCISMKDPSVVRFNGKWHVFCTIRSEQRSHQIEYLNFDQWEQANDAPRHILNLTTGYFCAPQVFYFSPEARWYLIYQ